MQDIQRVQLETARLGSAILSVVACAWFAAGCDGGDKSERHVDESNGIIAVDTVATSSASVGDEVEPCTDDVPCCASVAWAFDLEEAMKRGQREDKPVLIAFSARRQERELEHEF